MRAGSDNLAYVDLHVRLDRPPEGCRAPPRANLVWWHRDAYGVGESDRATQVAGLGFDASVWEIWPYLTAGASIHVPDEDARTDPARMREWLAAEAITLCFLPTPVAEAMLELGPLPGGRLRALLTGGDRLRRHPVRDLGFPLVNHYGPTEGTVVATAGVVPVASDEGRVPSIGRPIGNVRVYVLDARMGPVPIGVPGELYVGGEGWRADTSAAPS
jgi:non-ribosomal peptide synthetase component F